MWQFYFQTLSSHVKNLCQERCVPLWKANVTPEHKKDDKQILENYRPIFFLPICWKIFERLIYNKMREFLNENNLLSSNQLGFKQRNSCINQLISIIHDIYKSFDERCEERDVVLDVSKAFDEVWYEGLPLKLKQNGISGNLLSIVTDFLNNRKQIIVLNDQNSPWTLIEARVPQGSILGVLLILTYINGLSHNLASLAWRHLFLLSRK